LDRAGKDLFDQNKIDNDVLLVWTLISVDYFSVHEDTDKGGKFLAPLVCVLLLSEGEPLPQLVRRRDLPCGPLRLPGA